MINSLGLRIDYNRYSEPVEHISEVLNSIRFVFHDSNSLPSLLSPEVNIDIMTGNEIFLFPKMTIADESIYEYPLKM